MCFRVYEMSGTGSPQSQRAELGVGAWEGRTGVTAHGLGFPFRGKGEARELGPGDGYAASRMPPMPPKRML